MTRSRKSLPLLAALLCFAALPLPAATAAEDGIIIPEADPHPSEGYVDVYYHKCPVVGSDPCTHHYVGRVEIPCVAPNAKGTGADRVYVENCGEVLVDRPVCAPALTPTETTTTLTVTVAGCGVGPYGATVCKPQQTTSTSDLWVSYVTPTGCEREYVEPSGPWAEVESQGEGEYEIEFWWDCDYRTLTPRCSYYPDFEECVKVLATATPAPTYALGTCDNPVTGCITQQASPATDPITYSVGPCGSPVTGSQCVPKATPVNTATNLGATVSCGATSQTVTVCTPQQTTSTSDLWVSYVTPTGCEREYVEPSGPWAEVENLGGGQYEIEFWWDCDYRTLTPRCSYYPDFEECVVAKTATDAPNRRATVTTGTCDDPIPITVEVPCLATTVTPHADMRGVTYSVGPCASPVSGSQRVDDLPATPGPWVQFGSGGKYPGALFWIELYTDCTHDLDEPAEPACGGGYVPVTLGPYP